MTTVWVATDAYGIKGVFDSIKAVKAAFPGVVTWESEGPGWYAPAIGLLVFVYKVQTLDALG